MDTATFLNFYPLTHFKPLTQDCRCQTRPPLVDIIMLFNKIALTLLGMAAVALAVPNPNTYRSNAEVDPEVSVPQARSPGCDGIGPDGQSNCGGGGSNFGP
ncbi:hypothetical protein JVU11DRAFT_6965 [Chiua virens]|nr:hypothetical protein JVU11DRAFT_6965 [Chiua virens]